MQNISGFFKRIGGAFAKEVALRGAIQAAIKKITDIEVPINSIVFKHGVVTLKNIPHGARSVIFTKKQKVIDGINEELGKSGMANKVTDVR